MITAVKKKKHWLSVSYYGAKLKPPGLRHGAFRAGGRLSTAAVRKSISALAFVPSSALLAALAQGDTVILHCHWLSLAVIA
jgi:hypothetical protein